MDSIIPIMLLTIAVVGIGLLMIITFSRKGVGILNKSQYQGEWLAIENSITSSPSSQQFAIMQADKLLDKALRECGYKGETMGERMTNASRVFTKPDSTWAAHKLRNKIAHEHGFVITSKVTKRALLSYKKSLRDLGAL